MYRKLASQKARIGEWFLKHLTFAILCWLRPYWTSGMHVLNYLHYGSLYFMVVSKCDPPFCTARPVLQVVGSCVPVGTRKTSALVNQLGLGVDGQNGERRGRNGVETQVGRGQGWYQWQQLCWYLIDQPGSVQPCTSICSWYTKPSFQCGSWCRFN